MQCNNIINFFINFIIYIYLLYIYLFICLFFFIYKKVDIYEWLLQCKNK